MHRAAHDNVAHALFINMLLGAGEEERDGCAGTQNNSSVLGFSCACCRGRQLNRWGLLWMALEAARQGVERSGRCEKRRRERIRAGDYEVFGGQL